MVQPALQTLSDNTIREEYKKRFMKKRGEQLNSARDASEHAKAFLSDLPSDQEHFCVIFVDSQNKIISTEHLYSGGLNQAAVFTRSIVKRLIELEAQNILCFHNHPSGEVTPSNSDRATTRKLSEAVRTIDCELLDHLVIGDGYYSFSDQGLL